VQAYKKFSISKTPKILVVHLKRFGYRGGHGNIRERLDDVIDFPINDLDIKDYIENNDEEIKNEDTIYDLFAISV
jgi:hypothetical protein